MNSISDILMRTQEHKVFQCFNNLWSIERAEHGKSEEEYEEIEYDPEYDQAPQGDHSQTENDHESTEDDHESTEDDHKSTEDDHESTEDDHESTEDDRESTKDDHKRTEDDPGLSRQNPIFSFLILFI